MDEDKKQRCVEANSAVFMSVEPATDPKDVARRFLVLSFESRPSVIEQVAITHDDGHILLAELLSGLAAQQCYPAIVLKEQLEQMYDDEDEEEEDDDEDEAEDEEDDEAEPRNVVRPQEEGSVETVDDLLGDDDYGPDA